MTKLLIAITGGIGSGKSLVSEILREKGITVFDCDKISKEISNKQNVLDEIARTFGNEFIENGTLKRRELANFCFENKERTEKLNGIFHTAVYKELFERVNNCNEEIIFAEVPVLTEMAADKYFYKVWIVTADKETRIKRVIERNGITREEVLLRINRQMPLEKKKNRVFIENNASKEELCRKIYDLLLQL